MTGPVTRDTSGRVSQLAALRGLSSSVQRALLPKLAEEVAGEAGREGEEGETRGGEGGGLAEEGINVASVYNVVVYIMT